MVTSEVLAVKSGLARDVRRCKVTFGDGLPNAYYCFDNSNYMKKIVLFYLAVLTVLPSCTPDEELIQPVTLIDENVVGQWKYFYFDSFSAQWVDGSYSYFFLPDGNGYLAEHSDFQEVFPFVYQTFENSMFLQFADYVYNERAFDYSFGDEGNTLFLREIEDSEVFGRLERQ